MPHSKTESAMPGHRLPLGRVTITDAASAALENTGTEGVFLLSRHIHRDWGDITEKDVLQNELALLLGLRVLSRYRIGKGLVIGIVTEADRTITTIMLPDGYQGQSASTTP